MSELKNNTGQSLVRPLKEQDITSFYDCLCALIAERKYLTAVTPYPFEQVSAFAKEMLNSGAPQFVAIGPEGQVVGWCDVAIGSEEGYRHAGRIGMGVMAGFRGQGLGKQLLKQTLSECEWQGLYRLDLTVYASNKEAVKFYQKHGFEIEGRQKRARFIDGDFDDILIMARFIDENEPGKGRWS